MGELTYKVDCDGHLRQVHVDHLIPATSMMPTREMTAAKDNSQVASGSSDSVIPAITDTSLLEIPPAESPNLPVDSPKLHFTAQYYSCSNSMQIYTRPQETATTNRGTNLTFST